MFVNKCTTTTTTTTSVLKDMGFLHENIIWETSRQLCPLVWALSELLAFAQYLWAFQLTERDIPHNAGGGGGTLHNFKWLLIWGYSKNYRLQTSNPKNNRTHISTPKNNSIFYFKIYHYFSVSINLIWHKLFWAISHAIITLLLLCSNDHETWHRYEAWCILHNGNKKIVMSLLLHNYDIFTCILPDTLA